VFPLALSHLRGSPARNAFLLHRDGIDTMQTRALLGLRGRFSRLLPLLRPVSGAETVAPTTERLDPGDVLHGRLIEYARRCLYAPRALGGSAWARYVVERAHYGADASQAKLAQVGLWIDSLAPDTVLDLGCNTGEFSLAALERGARVIALDADHESVQQLYIGSAPSTRLHPVVANLADLHGGRGWKAAEHPSLLERLAGQADLLLMLALTHHLHFSEGIPLPEIAAFAASMTTAHLVLEVLPSDDPMVVHLASQRRRDPQAFTLQRQLDAFATHFEIVERRPLVGSGRELVLWKRRT
jgi:SAM-dependent methyltransferase